MTTRKDASSEAMNTVVSGGCPDTTWGGKTHVHDGEVCQDLVETFLECLLSEFNLAHVKGTDTVCVSR